MESVNLTVNEGLSKGKMRSIRRKQFFSFFEGFFDKHNKDSLKMKSANLSFTDEEKAVLLKKYFKQYFNEKLDLKKSAEEVKIEEEGTLSTLLNASQTPYYGKPNLVAENHKDAFLGRSDGILNSFVLKKQVKEMNEVIKDRKTRKMRPAKILIQSQFAPIKKDDVEFDENRS